MTEKIIILDFGSQVTQLIGRRLRELNVYCEIYPFNKIPALDESVKGVILSGSPFSVRDEKGPPGGPVRDQRQASSSGNLLRGTVSCI